MSSTLLFSFVTGYFVILLLVAWYTSRNSNNDSFFIGNRNSNWMLVAFGMIGTSLSGVTFVSVPGTVGSGGFGYFQVVIGNLIGYIIIAFVLLPLYYRLRLTSIYNYLHQRFGTVSYKTGALLFIVSRTLGATARLYIVINVLQLFILEKIGVRFEVTTFVILLMIVLYTFEGGVKTIVFTDTLQTTFMLVGLVACTLYIVSHLAVLPDGLFATMSAKGYTRIFDTDVNSSSFFIKSVLGGVFITVGMTGLDQEMMQKNISVRTLRDSQKNMMTFSSIMVAVNLLFLFLGALLYLFAEQNGIKTANDDLFPTVALSYLPKALSIVFIIGLISALFPSADGALTALTSSFCIDIIGLKRRDDLSEKRKKTLRLRTHFIFTIVFFLVVLGFKQMDNKSIIDVILKVAGFTYGPLLGLFAFGMITRRPIRDRAAIWVCLAAPLITLALDFVMNVGWYQKQLHINPQHLEAVSAFSKALFGSFRIGYELLVYNGMLTFAGLWMISKKNNGPD